MKKKRIYIALSIIAVIIIGIILIRGNSSKTSDSFLVEVKGGEFNINVVTTGELEAKDSEYIIGPTGARNFRVWDLTIQTMVADGTVVDSGQWVADLNRDEIGNTIQDLEDSYETSVTNYKKKVLDTAMTLRTLRDDIINQRFSVEEAKILLEQSIYEPPATIRKYEISLEKAERTLQQSIDNYDIKLQTAEADMQTVIMEMNKQERKLQQAQELLSQFTVYSPKAGMVVYRKDWNGKKIGIGSSISAWDPIVAELPDLTNMISKTYVNEVDVSKVKVGQPVDITVEAFPERSYTGMVKEVANIGEQVSGSNAKVFEVLIEVNEYDSILRPAMTTVNNIKTQTLSNTMYVPIECIFNEGGIPFVYTSQGRKQEVTVGQSNDNEIIIIKGLNIGDEIYITPPEGSEKLSLKRL